jgi:hypothetical protein
MAVLNALWDAKNNKSQEVSSMLNNQGSLDLQKLAVQNPSKATQAMELLLNSTGPKPVINEDGSVTFTVRKLVKDKDTGVVSEDYQVVKTQDPDVRLAVENAEKFSQASLKQLEDNFVIRRLKDLGFSGDISRSHLKDTADIIEAERNILQSSKAGNTEVQQRIDDLDQRATILKNIIGWIDRINAFKKGGIYVPRKREGQFGLTVMSKKVGDVNSKKWGFYTFGDGQFFDNNRGYSKSQLREQIARIKKDFAGFEDDFFVVGDSDGKGGRINYELKDLDENTVKPKLLSRNRLAQNLDDRTAASTIEDLMELAVIDGDLETRDALQGILDVKRASDQNYQFILPSNDLRGASLDMASVYQRQTNALGNYIANQEYKPKMQQLKSSLRRHEYFDPEINPYAEAHEKVFDYVTSAEESTGWIRSAQFLMALGGNVSTAAIQLVNLGTFTPAYMYGWNQDVFKTATIIGRNAKNIPKMMTDAITKGAFSDPIAFEKHIQSSNYMHPDAKAFITKFPNSRHLGGQLSHDVMRQLVEKERRGKLTSPFLKASYALGKKGMSFAGAMMATTESTGRMVTMNSFFEALSDPQTLEAAYNQVKDNPAFQEQMKYNKVKNASLKDNLVMFFIDEAFGVQGKSGRSVINQSTLGNIVFPFVGFQLQQLSAIAKAFSFSPRSGAAILAAYYMLAGLSGIPGFSNADEISKILFGVFGDKGGSLQFSIQELMRKQGVDPQLNDLLTHGVADKVTDTRISSRIGLGLPVFDTLLKFTRADQAPLETTILGSYLMTAVKEMGNAIRGDDVNATELIPFAAAKNAIKGWQATQGPVLNRKGKPILQEQDWVFGLKKALGFKPGDEARAQDAVLYNFLNDRSPRLEGLRSEMVDTIYEMRRASGPEKEAQREKLRQIFKEISMIKKDNEEPYNYKSDLTRATRTAVELETGKPTKKIGKKAREINQYYGKLEESP